jgi:hypothetical protein
MTNYIVISVTVLATAGLIIWLVKRNRKDREDFERELNDNYSKPKDGENEM